MAVQKVAEKPYVEPSIGQHLQLLRTSKGLRNLVLNTAADGDIKLLWHALDKLQERGAWLELWVAVFKTKENSPRRKWVTDRLFSKHVDEKKAERIGDELKHRVLFSKNKPKIDDEAAKLLADWMAKNGMWKQLMSVSLFGGKALNDAAEMRFKNLSVDEADQILKLDGHLAFDIWHSGVNNPEVGKHLEGKLEKSGESFNRD